MSPYELAAFFIILPIVTTVVWFVRRFEADGASVPEFEAWCRTERPVLFALRCARGGAALVAAKMTEALGARLEVEHHRGRHPWTLYVFSLELEVDTGDDVVVGRVRRCAIRRGRVERPELGAMIDEVTTTMGDRLTTMWLHAELIDAEAAPFAERRRSGWLVAVGRAAVGELSPTPTEDRPTWARARAA